MECFITKLFDEFVGSLRNDYSDNYDTERFGKEPIPPRLFRSRLVSIIKKKKYIINNTQINHFNSLDKYYTRMSQVYNILDDDYSKSLYIKLIVYRILGHRYVKLPLNSPDYRAKKILSEELKTNADSIEAPFVDGKTVKLHLFDLSQKNIPLKLYTTDVYPLLYINQYENDNVRISSGDILLDCGGCWGDTALLFAYKVGNSGHVYSFEFVPENIDIFKQNMSLNENVSSKISLVENALSEKTGETLCFSNNGPGSRIGTTITGATNVQSITIDDFVKKNDLSRIDYIKMDIEGSELPSLKGAVNVLKEFRPKLAISIYHSLDDFVDIPLFLESLHLGYHFYIKHGTIHSEETVLLATCK